MKSPVYLPSTFATARKCGHQYEIVHAINAQGEHVSQHTACPDPTDPDSPYDANDLCPDCYAAAMDRTHGRMSFDQMVAAWGGR